MKIKFGSHLRTLRGNSSQGEIASVFGVSQSAYSAWERGTKEPSLTTISSICTHYNVSADWLLGLCTAVQPKATPNVASATPDVACFQPAPDSYWRDLVASQQATISLLVRRLEAPNEPATPAATGGHTAVKSA